MKLRGIFAGRRTAVTRRNRIDEIQCPSSREKNLRCRRSRKARDSVSIRARPTGRFGPNPMCTNAEADPGPPLYENAIGRFENVADVVLRIRDIKHRSFRRAAVIINNNRSCRRRVRDRLSADICGVMRHHRFLSWRGSARSLLRLRVRMPVAALPATRRKISTSLS